MAVVEEHVMERIASASLHHPESKLVDSKEFPAWHLTDDQSYDGRTVVT